MQRNKQWRLAGLAFLMLLAPAAAYADTSSSANYQVDQTFFGSGGELNACSASYCSKQTAGELAVGSTAGTLYQAYAGFNTTDAPFIEFYVTSSSTDLDYLDTGAPTTTTGQFYVRAWQAAGYVVRTESDPPANTTNNYEITPLASASASSPGSEQFGINLVDNTAPNIGSNPLQVPDNTFSFGEAEPGYDTINQFKYNKGDIIARSTKSTSVTVFTVSYLFNISETTPSGEYVFRHTLIATGTY